MMDHEDGTRLSDYDFDLPEVLIATRPAKPRSSARLLVATRGQIHDRVVTDLVDWLRPGDRLVLNDTRVIPARLEGHRERGEAIARIDEVLGDGSSGTVPEAPPEVTDPVINLPLDMGTEATEPAQ